MRTTCSAALLAVMLVLAGCGGTPGQVPTRDEPKIDAALTTLAASCGEAVEIRATGRDEPGLSRLDATASTASRRLRALVRTSGPLAYENESLRTLAAGWATNLRQCGLRRSAAALGP